MMPRVQRQSFKFHEKYGREKDNSPSVPPTASPQGKTDKKRRRPPSPSLPVGGIGVERLRK